MEKLVKAELLPAKEYTQGRLEIILDLEAELESMRKDKIQGLMVRSRVNWHYEGEKPSRFSSL